MSLARQSTLSGQLARLGFQQSARAEGLIHGPEFDAVLGREEDPEALDPTAPPLRDPVLLDDLLLALSEAADPDLALLGLARVLGGDDPCRTGLTTLLQQDSANRTGLIKVLGASAALGDYLARHPEQWSAADPQAPAPTTAQLRAELLTAVGADPRAQVPLAGGVAAAGGSAAAVAAAHDALRVAYYRCLLGIAARDLTAVDPMAMMPQVAAELAALAAAALDAALAVARGQQPVEASGCRFAVIGMGKCGGRELNYVSDVDVIYVAEPLPGQDEAPALASATKLAAALAKACSAATAEGTLWPVDAALRPEGKRGPLVRTVESHLAYYRRWAETWEFQALLKARVVAGDVELGQAYLDALTPLVWRAAERENFVPDVQAMRRRVEQTLPPREAARQLKLGAGGLRDVEFSVQLLQLVHGRGDPRLRTGNTLEGLEALSTFGYVGRDDAAELDLAYRMLRCLEHRIQLHRLRRTQVVPDKPEDLRRLGRAFGFRRVPEQALEDLWRRHALEVRRLHEKLFYRPLLAAAARLSTDEVRLTPEAAHARLSALGYRDPVGAMRHLAALTSGVSRRAAIQRQLLAVMLGWFADGADPDAGLLAFRRVSELLGTTHWYLKMLRDSGAAAERMAHVLSASRLVAGLIERAPEMVALLEGDSQLVPQSRAVTLASARRAADRHLDDAEAATFAVRAVRRRELVRTAIADIVGLVDLAQVGHALSDAAVAALDAGLRAAEADVERRTGKPLPTRLLVVAMGRLGGGELGYGSDADVLFVHDPLTGADEREAQDAAMAVFSELRRLLAAPGAEPGLEVDAALRPEGRSGPLIRTFDSYVKYYERWSETWEAQALLRALPAAGDEELGARFTALVDPVRWPERGLEEATVREIRRIKARVESERLPRGADPARHLKLGRGGISDVEWTVQLLQLQHAGRLEGLRTTSTRGALAGARDAGLLTGEDHDVLLEAWELASRVRNAVVLWRGKSADSLPTAVRELDGVARIVGYPPASAAILEDDYRRIARRARAVVTRVFYGEG